MYAREEAGQATSYATELSLPIGTRFAFHGKDSSCYVIEEAPRVRTVLWDKKPMRLALPYIIFVITMSGDSYDKLFLFFRNKPLRAATDTLSVATLPDVMENNHSVCYPGPKILRGNHADIVASVQEMFWNSSFTSGHWRSANRGHFDKIPNFSFEEWVKITAENPGAVLAVDWPGTNITPQAFGKQVLTQQPTLDLKRSLSNLERYTGELAERLSIEVQEAVVENIMDSQGPVVARKAFTAAITTALQDMEIAETTALILKTHMESSSGDEEIAAIVNQAAKRAAAQIADVLIPSSTILTTAIQKSLQ